MTDKIYCMVNKDTNICDNVVVWNGDVQQWQPPSNYLMLIQENTLTKNWIWNRELLEWQAFPDSVNDGGIGDTWDGTYLTPPMPTEPPALPVVAQNQPTSTGTTTL